MEPWGVSPQPPQPPQPHPYWARAIPPDTNKIKANPRGIRIHRSIVNLLAAEHERRPTQMKWAGENEVEVIRNPSKSESSRKRPSFLSYNPNIDAVRSRSRAPSLCEVRRPWLARPSRGRQHDAPPPVKYRQGVRGRYRSPIATVAESGSLTGDREPRGRVAWRRRRPHRATRASRVSSGDSLSCSNRNRIGPIASSSPGWSRASSSNRPLTRTPLRLPRSRISTRS